MLSKLKPRDRLALAAGAAAVALFFVLRFGLFPLLDRWPGGSIEERELALRRSQRLVANAGTDLASLGAVQERVTTLEAGLLESPSSSLANAEWQRLVRELADSKSLELGSTEFLRVQQVSPNYGLVVGRVTLRCRLDQLVDFLAALATAPRIFSVTRLRLAPIPGDAGKRISVEIMLGAAVHAMPGAKGGASDQP
ncbi:MAG TPA: type II secretion system protein GspM [Terriglobia bacterium]|nr:type II secretion system protein GspM [Terriglobia bacterium]